MRLYVALGLLMVLAVAMIVVCTLFAVRELKEERRLKALGSIIWPTSLPTRPVSFPVRVTKLTDRRRRTRATAPLLVPPVSAQAVETVFPRH